MAKFELKALIMGVDRLSPQLDKVRKNVAGFRKKLVSSGLGKPISIREIVTGGALAAPFVAATKAAIDFESSMADVKKVVSFDTPEQFQEMSADIIEMSKRMPMAASEIASIFAAGGQSNIAREELAKFAEDAVKMGVAFDQTADEAGSMMAKWRAAFKMNQDEVAALADQINELGNQGAASAGQISKVVTAIGPLGEIAGVSSGELAALGATLAGVGVDENVAATGLSRFFTTLNAGTAATKRQADILKALRMDPKEVAKGMTEDARGTMMRVLKAISQVDQDKQVSVMQQLFGESGMKAVAPLLTSLDTLQKNMDLVGDSTRYAGSMQHEYDARAATTANALRLLRNRVTALGNAVGSVLLPPLNQFLAFVGPLIDGVTKLAGENPWLIKGLLGAAGAFAAVRLAVYGVVLATRVLSAVMSMSPVGIIVRGLAFAAGFLMANWSSVAPYFKALWEKIRGPLETLWEVIKTVFNWSPLGLVVNNWSAISGWFAELWESVKAPAQAVWDWLKDAFFNWHPLGLITKNWEPIVDWFKRLWDRVKKFIDPILNGMEAVKSVTSGIGDTVSSAKEKVTGGISSGWNWFKEKTGLGEAPAPAPAASESRLNGELQIRFENAPPGMRAEPMQTNQSGLQVRQNVGYRSMSMAGAS